MLLLLLSIFAGSQDFCVCDDYSSTCERYPDAETILIKDVAGKVAVATEPATFLVNVDTFELVDDMISDSVPIAFIRLADEVTFEIDEGVEDGGDVQLENLEVSVTGNIHFQRLVLLSTSLVITEEKAVTAVTLETDGPMHEQVSCIDLVVIIPRRVSANISIHHNVYRPEEGTISPSLVVLMNGLSNIVLTFVEDGILCTGVGAVVSIAAAKESGFMNVTAIGCGSVTVGGSKSDLYNTHLSSLDGTNLVLNNGLYLRNALITVNNALVTLNDGAYTPKAMEIEESKLTVFGGVQVWESITVNGDLEVEFGTEASLLKTELLKLNKGEVTYDTGSVTPCIITHYVEISREGDSQLEIYCKVPLVVYYAIRPGTLSVTLEKVSFFLEASGFDVVLDIDADEGYKIQEIKPVIIKSMSGAGEAIPIEMSLESSDPVNNAFREKFFMENTEEIVEVAKIPDNVPGMIVFDHFMYNGEEATSGQGFTANNSGFTTENEEEDGMFVIKVGIEKSDSPSVVLICISDSDCAVGYTSVQKDKWYEEIPKSVTNVTFFIAINSFELDLSKLDVDSNYTVCIWADPDVLVPSVVVKFRQDESKVVTEISASNVKLELVDGIVLDRLVIWGDSLTLDRHELTVSVLDIEFSLLRKSNSLLDGAKAIWIGGMSTVNAITINGTEWVFYIADEDEDGYEMDAQWLSGLPVNMRWPETAGYLKHDGAPVEGLALYPGRMANLTLVDPLFQEPLIHLSEEYASVNFTLSPTDPASAMFIPIVLDQSTNTTYTISLDCTTAGVQTEFIGDWFVGSGGTIDLTVSNNFTRVSLPKNVTIAGGLIHIESEAGVTHFANVTVQPDDTYTSEIQGGVIGPNMNMYNLSYLTLDAVSWDRTAIQFHIQSDMYSPTIIWDVEQLPTSIEVFHAFEDSEYDDVLEWLWSNNAPLVCSDEIDFDGLEAITKFNVVGSDTLELTATQGEVNGRQCFMMNRKHHTVVSEAIIAGMVTGVIVTICIVGVILFYTCQGT